MTADTIGWADVQSLLNGPSRPTVWRWWKEGIFPRPLRVTNHGPLAWNRAEVMAWIMKGVYAHKRPRFFEDRYMPEPMSGCWLWISTLRPDGYGAIYLGHRMEVAHRVSWQLTHGSISDNLCVLHKCDVRACVNPDHLFLGTKGDNIRDAAEKGRTSRGEKQHNAKLSEAQVLQIRQRLALGESQSSISRSVGIGQAQVSRIKLRQDWGWL